MSKTCAQTGQNPMENPVYTLPQVLHRLAIFTQNPTSLCKQSPTYPKHLHTIFTQLCTYISIIHARGKPPTYPLLHTPYYYNYYIYK